MRIALLVVILLLVGSTSANSHSGRTDKNGCHTDNSTGTRHCHNGGGGGGSIPATAPTGTGASSPPSEITPLSGFCSSYANCMQLGREAVRQEEYLRALNYFRGALLYQPEDIDAHNSLINAENLFYPYSSRQN